MSQYIEKFESGGSPKTIKRGKEDVELDRYVRNLESNFEGWLNDQGFDKKTREEVTNAYQEMLSGYKAGTLTSKSTDSGKLISEDSTGKIKSTKGDAYSKVQRYFNTVLNAAPTYTDPEKAKLIKYDPSKGISVALNRTLFGGRDTYDKNFLLQDTYDEASSTRGTQNRASKLSSALAGLRETLGDYYDISDKDKAGIQSNIDILTQALADGKIEENERLALSNLGIDPDVYFYTGKDYDTPKAEPEKEKTEEEKLQDEYNNVVKDIQLGNTRDQLELLKKYQRFKQMEDPNLSLDLSKYTYNTLSKTPIENLSAATQEKYKKWISDSLGKFTNWLATHNIYEKPKDWWNQVGTDDFGGVQNIIIYGKDKELLRSEIASNWTNAQKFKYLMDLYSKYGKDVAQTAQFNHPDGHLVMSYDDNGYASVYDPTTSRLYNTAMGKIPGYLDWLPEFASVRPATTEQATSHKEGGILFAKGGLGITNTNTLSESLAAEKKVKETAEQARLQKKATKSGKTVEEIQKQEEASERKVGDGLTAVDKARMTAIGIDLASAVASFTGVGSIVGGIGGVAGTLTAFGADWADDSVSAGDMFKNLGVGLGLSAIGFIPVVGGAGKFANAIGKVVKYVPKILAVASAAGTVMDDDVRNSVSKFQNISLNNLTHPEKWMKENNITNEDLKNLTYAVGAVTGLTRASTNSIKKRIVKAAAKGDPTADTYVLKNTKNGSVTLTKEQYNKFKEFKKSEGANKYLKSIQEQQDNEITAARRYVKGLAGRRDRFNQNDLEMKKGSDTYDFDQIEATKLGKFFIGDPNSRWSDAGIVKYNVENPINLRNPFSSISNPFFNRVRPPEAPTRRIVPFGNYSPIARSPKPNLNGIRPVGSKPIMRWAGAPSPIARPSQQPLSITNLSPVPLPINTPTPNEFSLTRFKLGGRLRKFAGGGSTTKPITNTSYDSDKYSWDKLIYDTDYFKSALGSINLDNFEDANNLQNEFYYNNINYNWDKNPTVNRQEVKDYQTKFNTRYGKWLNQGAIEDAIKNKAIFRAGNSGDNLAGNYSEGYSGAMTNLRHLGTDAAAKYINAMNEILKKNNLYAFVNDKTKMINFGRLNNSNNSNDIINNSSANPTNIENDIDPTQIEQDELQNKPYDVSKMPFNWRQLTGKAYGLARYFGTLRTNRDIYNTMRDAIRPSLHNTFELYSPVTGAFSTMQLKNKQSADVSFDAARQRSANLEQTLGMRLAANRQAQELQTQGFSADDQEIQRTKEAARQRVESNIARRSELANKNKDALNEYRRTQGQLKSDYLLKNWNVTANRLYENEDRMNREVEQFRNFYMQNELDRAKQIYKSRVQAAYDNLKLAMSKPENKDKDYTTLPEYEEYRRVSNDETINLQNAQGTIQGSAYGYTYNPIKIPWRLSYS